MIYAYILHIDHAYRDEACKNLPSIYKTLQGKDRICELYWIIEFS